MGDDYDSEEKKLLSDFNEAKFQILRLHNIWNTCNLLSCSGKLTEWNWKLDAAWRELRKDAKDLDKEEEPKDKDSFYQRMEKIDSQIVINIKNSSKLYQTLMKKEMILRELQDSSGKGSKKSKEDEYVMD